MKDFQLEKLFSEISAKIIIGYIVLEGIFIVFFNIN